MEDWIIPLYAEIEAIKAEIEGMKATNQCLIQQGETLAYDESAFQERVKSLLGIANCIRNYR